LSWPQCAEIIAASTKTDVKERSMSDSVYRVTEVIGTSADSWEAAARNAVETAARSIRDIRVAEATRFDVTIQDGKIAEYRVRLGISFKYEAGD
jgi:flavin-binding protein dodecin